MKRKLLTLILIGSLLSSCGKDTGLAPPAQLPPLPERLAEKSYQLPANSDTSMGAQVLDNTNTIKQYNQVATDKNRLIDIYNCVRDSINNKKDVIKCL